jgi:hypothetical protein
MKKKKSLAKRIILAIVLTFVGILVSVGIQVGFNLSIEALPQRPATSIDSGGVERVLYYYGLDARGEALPEGIALTSEFVLSELQGTFDYINGRYDVADFRMNSLVRLYLGYENILPQTVKDEIKVVMLGFKYWMDQGGADSMCYWSENHQILFSTQEYLVGQTFPDDVFEVDGKTGAEHMEMAKVRVEAWMYQRFHYGFTEWYSNNYYPEDVAPMANFIQFADDLEMVNRMKMIMDIIWFDMATQSWKFDGFDGALPRTYYVFLPSAGRAYSDNRASDDLGNRMRNFIDFVIQPDETKDFEQSWNTSRNGFFNSFRQMMEAKQTDNTPFYEVPEVIKAIFDDPSPEKIFMSSQSLDTEELAGEGLLGQEDHQIMMQLAMEAFTNPAVINNTMEYIAKNKMFTNDFLNDFKLINIWPLRALRLLDTVSEMLQPSTNGVAIERANVYTYQTNDYMMSTAQAHQAGDYADQQAVSSINLSNEVSIFTTQPAKIPRRSGTPTYWTGNGRMAYSIQEKNVLVELYPTPTKVGFMEPMIVEKTTHVYFPTQLFDEVDVSGLANGVIFGRIGDTFIGIRARYALAFVPFATSNQEGDRDDMLVRGSTGQVLTEDYDLVQYGDGMHYFVTELSAASQETFTAFKARMIANPLEFEPELHLLTYSSLLNNEILVSTLEVRAFDSFRLNGDLVDTNYGRYQNAYVPEGLTLRKPGIITYQFQGQSLILNYADNTRTEIR